MNGLTEEDALNLRDGDIVLVPYAVKRTNNHFDKGTGVKLTCRATHNDYRMREEREKGPALVDIQSRYVHSVFRRTLRIGDWVEWDREGVGAGAAVEQGRIIFSDGDEHTVKQRADRTVRNRVIKHGALRRIPKPDDLSEAEKKVFA